MERKRLQQIIAGGQAVPHPGIIFCNGQKNDLTEPVFLAQPSGGLYSIHVLHIDVHKDKLKIDLGGSFQKILSVLKFCQRIVQLMLFHIIFQAGRQFFSILCSVIHNRNLHRAISFAQ